MLIKARDLQQADSVLLGDQGVGVIQRVTTGNTHATVYWEAGENGPMQPSFFELEAELEVSRDEPDPA